MNRKPIAFLEVPESAPPAVRPALVAGVILLVLVVIGYLMKGV